MDLALVLKFLQLLCWLPREVRRQVLRVDLMEACIKTEGTLFECSHLLNTISEFSWLSVNALWSGELTLDASLGSFVE